MMPNPKCCALVCLMIFAHWHVVDLVAINNSIIGTPLVDCGQASITLGFQTLNPFEGRIFAQNFANDADCSVAGHGETNPTKSFQFAQQACGLMRQRTPTDFARRGMDTYITVIVSFHKQFVTKVDRAFRISCFYMESDKSVAAELDVSMVPTESLTVTVPMPVCTYDILDQVTQQPLHYAKVGQPVNHRWICDTVQPEVFCMLVHSCYVRDGTGGTAPILDPLGCEIDQHLLQALDYIDDLTASTEAHVFKFADRNQMYFDCQLSLTIRVEGQQCPRPQCSPQSQLRGKRAVQENATMLHYPVKAQDKDVVAQFDLPPQRLVILDLEDSQDNDVADRELKALQRLRSNAEQAIAATDDIVEEIARTADIDSRESHGICFSSVGLALLVTLLVVLGCISVSVTTVLILFVCRGKLVFGRGP